MKMKLFSGRKYFLFKYKGNLNYEEDSELLYYIWYKVCVCIDTIFGIYI